MDTIHTDHNGVRVEAATGGDDKGHFYRILVGADTTRLKFQQGPVKEHGVNGITNEALLAVLKNRLDHLQEKFPCDENVVAIFCVTQALEILEARTRDRISRNVEGLDIA